jgi:hypothetical protein
MLAFPSEFKPWTSALIIMHIIDGPLRALDLSALLFIGLSHQHEELATPDIKPDRMFEHLEF